MPFCTELKLFKQTPVHTRKFEDKADAFDEAIKFIMADLQNHICEVIRFGPFRSRFRYELRCHTVLGHEPQNAFAPIVHLEYDPLLPLFAIAKVATVMIKSEMGTVCHIFSKTFFKGRNLVL